jgi:hypothetical protein
MMEWRDGHAMLATAARTTGAGRVAKDGANRQNEYSGRQILRRYGVI